MSRSTVSVVIPVKDDAGKLLHCLEALARQQMAPREIIVVDNGSSDDSAGVARRNGAEVLFEPRPGIGVASAAGYNRARGDILARLDADSVPAPDWIATILRSFHADASVDAITGPAHFNDGPSALRRPALLAYLLPYFALSSLALGHVPLFGSNMAFRRRAWHEVRNHLHTDRWLVHDDFDLSFHLGVEHVLRFVPTLRTGISMRPFHDGAAALRLRRGFHTVFLHWPHDLPWLRLTRRLRRRFRRPTIRGQYDGGTPGDTASWDA
ncbi:glycosyltransferase family 2 protein [Arthrobacter rhombi]|uniref:glycosyltransferase family 2 protein n=1 Tax=Arthrobacter rhombi TaxID=71253 RepID=UPI003FD2CBCC